MTYFASCGGKTISVSVEGNLAELGLSLPAVPTPAGSFLPVASAGRLIFASGRTAKRDREPPYPSCLGREVNVEQGQEAAREAAVLCLAELKSVLGNLDNVDRVVKFNGWLASAPDFADQPKVIVDASQLLMDLFGEAGRHARAAIGVAALPGGACVERKLSVWAK
jgi:enamine deaminase RidA (YjgF/YER057c/UK114 family)